VIHIVTVFFPEPGVKLGKARGYLIQRRYLIPGRMGHRPIFVPRYPDWRVRTKQVNKLVRSITVVKLMKYELQAIRHNPRYSGRRSHAK
jgi:hypothetical protein